MLPWRGIVCHILILSVQPVYLTVRYLLNPDYLSRERSLWFALAAISWIYIVTKVTIPFFTSPLRHLPYPPIDIFPIGHLDFNGGKPFTRKGERLLATPNDGLLVLWMPLYLGCQIIPTKPETLMEVLNTCSYDWEKPGVEKKLLSGVLGKGLVTVDGQEHKAMRRVVSPAFAGHHIRNLAPLFYSKALESADFMAAELKKSEDAVLEILSLMSRMTLDIICVAGIGRDFHNVEKADISLADSYEAIINAERGPPWLFVLVHLLFPTSIFEYFKGTPYARIAKLQARLRAKVRALLTEKKKALKMEETAQEKDIIATIMRSGSFPDDYLVDQLLTFFAAGHDTTASALTWALHLLSENPAMQDRLRAECDAQLPNKDPTEIDASTFEPGQMPYLNAVCNETLRLYPPAPAVSRVCVHPTTVGNVSVPVGTQALIPPWAINRNPDLWGADAHEFNPDRWLNGPDAAHGGATSPYALLTFLHGPRSCIGQGFARLEFKCVLAVLMLRFTFTTADPTKEVEVGGFLVAKPDGGLRLKMRDRREEAGAGLGTQQPSSALSS